MISGAAALAACRRETIVGAASSSSSARAPIASSSASRDPTQLPGRAGSALRIVEWDFPTDGAFEKRAVVLIPDPLPPGAKLPLLVALHGMGETIDPVTGSNGWLKSYEIDDADAALRAPPLSADDFRGLVTDERLATLNASLVAKPFQGLVIACPYLPKMIGLDVPFESYGEFLAKTLVPRLRAEMPVSKSVRSTGIDGVSLGGISALRIGLSRADVFGAVGGLQPAIWDYQIDELAEACQKQIGKRPLRITTSVGDIYHDALIALDQRLTARGVAHDFFVAEGPHDYIWNKGPGAIEMLLWQDRALR